MAPTRSDLHLLRWYVEMGADEAIGWQARDRLSAKKVLRIAPEVRGDPATGATPPLAEPAVATSLAALEAAVRAFEACALKRTATNTVFADGVAGAPLMIIGEAPGSDEDRIGRPFVGRSGQLLDRMLATIGFSRTTNAYITNILFWRPPGNRKPTGDEIASCLPFVWQHVALAKPRVVLLSGGTAVAAMLERREGIMRLRGRWFDLKVPGIDAPIPALATYHPSFLLRTPAHKSEVWRDLLALENHFHKLG
jgi:uracil-DNA glycosylase family 4